jgi:hypothetical protein
VVKTVDPYEYSYKWDGINYSLEERPKPHHLWFSPFHEAVTSGMVDGGSAATNHRQTSGAVSDQPELFNNADGFSG